MGLRDFRFLICGLMIAMIKYWLNVNYFSIRGTLGFVAFCYFHHINTGTL